MQETFIIMDMDNSSSSERSKSRKENEAYSEESFGRIMSNMRERKQTVTFAQESSDQYAKEEARKGSKEESQMASEEGKKGGKRKVAPKKTVSKKKGGHRCQSCHHPQLKESWFRSLH